MGKIRGLRGGGMKITPVILCGGSGTRLWPLSRQHFPKQFLSLTDDKTLFQKSISRAIALESDDIQIEEILIVTNENHRFLVLAQLDEMKLKTSIRVLLEPEPKNTAPALTLSALAAQDCNSDSILVVTPADQYIKNLACFVSAMHEAIRAVDNKTIVTLGIKATRPDIGFGYIHYHGNNIVKDVLSFKEKPKLEVAKNLIGQGQHAWNGGIFILKPKTWLNAIQQSKPEMTNFIKKSWQQKDKDQWFERPNYTLFKQSPSDSIDYAVLEKASSLGINIMLVELDAGWSDLGSFNALCEIEEKDQDGNVFKGDVNSLNSKNTIAISSKKNVSLLGVENLIIIETTDCVLVANKDDAQSIKKLLNILEKNHSQLLIEHTKVNRPWGWFETLEEENNFKVKRIQIDPGKSISLQLHHQRSEHWVVVKGEATIIKDCEEFNLTINQSTYIEKKQIHQIINNSDEILQIIEVQSGEYLGEDDIERIEDKYGR